MLNLTPEQIIDWEPCEDYTESRLRELADRIDLQSVKTVTELINRLQGVIPSNHILWLVLRKELIPAENLHKFACWVAAIALHREREYSREPDVRSWAAPARILW